ncbi:MAG: 3-keto-5-aminohexanoate cleavage protein, partial [Nitrospirae bacterium]|nr:3-keto-5-aminohexanoate cleavage protein [Nitrospirota bacterium]
MISREINNNGFDTADPHPLKPYDKLIINAAITGMNPTKKDTPYVPVAVDEIIEDAVKCVSAGAGILHLHARDK